MLSHSEQFSNLSALHQQGRHHEALAALRSLLRNQMLRPEHLERAGRLLAKSRQARDQDLRVRVLAQCTTSWLPHVLEALSYGRGLELSATQGEFDNVMQELSALREPCDVVVLLPWNQRLLGDDDRGVSQRLDDELAFWQDAWRLAQSRGVKRIIQVGYDWVLPGASGQHLGGREGGDVAIVRALNERLRRALPSDAYFVDLEAISGLVGRLHFYDARQYHWTKQPFSEAGLIELARNLVAGVRACTTGGKKVLVVDLDNTLWGGVVGELGPLGVRCGDGVEGEAFASFQKHLRALSKRGVLLAVASKNNHADAREPFDKHASMVLSVDDFAAFEASWEPKATMLRSIAQRLRLGLNSFVFFDDNPAEREHIRQALPEVEVVEVPPEPADYVRALQLGGWFESLALTAEDAMRAQQYTSERAREQARAEFESIDGYLASLGMNACVRLVDEADLRRVAQLLSKTNQFNLTTRRHTEDEVRRMIACRGSVCLTSRLQDRFGDHGLVACVLALPVDDSPLATLRVDTWLMSCRVIGRTLEHFMLRELATRAAALGYRRLLGEYIPTSKNQPVATLYPDLGFDALPDGSGATRFYCLDLPLAKAPRTFVNSDAICST